MLAKRTPILLRYLSDGLMFTNSPTPATRAKLNRGIKASMMYSACCNVTLLASEAIFSFTVVPVGASNTPNTDENSNTIIKPSAATVIYVPNPF